MNEEDRDSKRDRTMHEESLTESSYSRFSSFSSLPPSLPGSNGGSADDTEEPNRRRQETLHQPARHN